MPKGYWVTGPDGVQRFVTPTQAQATENEAVDSNQQPITSGVDVNQPYVNADQLASLFDLPDTNTPQTVVTDTPTTPQIITGPSDPNAPQSPDPTSFGAEPDPINQNVPPDTPSIEVTGASPMVAPQAIQDYWNAVDQYGQGNFGYDANGNIVPNSPISDSAVQSAIQSGPQMASNQPTDTISTDPLPETSSDVQQSEELAPQPQDQTPSVEVSGDSPNVNSAISDYWNAVSQYGEGNFGYDESGNIVPNSDQPITSGEVFQQVSQPEVDIPTDQSGSVTTPPSTSPDEIPFNPNANVTIPSVNSAAPPPPDPFAASNPMNVGPNFSGYGGGLYGGLVQLSNGSVVQRGTGMDPMQSTSPTLALTRSAMAEVPESGGRLNASRVSGISAQTAKNAANYWGRGGFSQKAGTSGLTTIG